MRKRVPAAVLAVLLAWSLAAPVLAAEEGDTEYVSKDTFWNWLSGNTSGILHTVIGYTAGSVCTQSEDGYHHSSSTLGRPVNILGQESPYYECICDACGQKFKAYETDVKQSYDASVAELPAPVYGSDGSIYVIPAFQIRHGDASVLLFELSNGETKEDSNGFYRCSMNLPLIQFEILKQLYDSSSLCIYSVDLYADIPFLCSAELLFSSATYSTNTQSGQLSFYGSSSYYKGGVKDYQAGSRFYAGLQTSGLSMIKDGKYVLAGNFILFSLADVRLKLTPYATLDDAIYNTITRPTSITGGNYGIIGDNGQITQVTDNSTIVNEVTNTYYNPVTGEASTITDWSYDYSDRSYNLTLEGGDTSTVTYGDENITITETTINESGDTIINNYTIYYIIEGSGTGTGSENPPAACTHNWQETSTTPATCTVPGSRLLTCSLCNQTKTETIPALGHTWQVERIVHTAYDDEGSLIQQGYTIYQCAVCGEQYKDIEGTGPPGSSSGGGNSGEEKETLWDKIGNLIGSVFEGLIGMVEAVLGKILDGLNSLAGMLMEKLTAVVETVLTLMDEVPKLFGGFLDFLAAIFPFLPPEITLLLTFGVAAVVFVGIIKAIRR